MRVARDIEHTADVDGVMRNYTPRQLKEWLAFFAVEADARDQAAKEAELEADVRARLAP